MRIGIVTAMAEEMKPIYRKMGNIVDENVIHGVRISRVEFDGNTIYLATGGVGEIRAAMTVQMLVDLFDIEAMINFGLVGALNKELKIGELVIADRVCHYQFDASAIDGTRVGQYYGNPDIYFYLDDKLITSTLAAIGKPMRKVAVASGDVFVAGEEKKKRLAEEFDCDICEMELAALAIACKRNNIPLLSIKAVSDAADGDAVMNFEEVVKKGIDQYEKILPSVLDALTGNSKPLPPIKTRILS